MFFSTLQQIGVKDKLLSSGSGRMMVSLDKYGVTNRKCSIESARLRFQVVVADLGSHRNGLRRSESEPSGDGH